MTPRTGILLRGAAYAAIGVVFARFGGSQAVILASRWAAWIVSAALFAQHIWSGHRDGLPPKTTAVRAAAAAALGSFGLAAGGMIHSFSTPAGFRPLWILMLVVWPALVAVPAFVVALCAAAILGRLAKPGAVR